MELHASYKITMWFVNNAQRMLELVNTIVDSAADIVAHNLAGASAKVENAMAKVVPIAIGFLAGVIGIGNLSKKVGDIIDRVKVPITKAIDWVVDKAVSFADKLGITKMIEKGTKWVKDKVAKIGDKVMGWLGFKKQFTSNDGHKHQIYTEGEGQSMKVMVASDAKPMEQILEELNKAELTPAEEKLKGEAKELNDELHKNAKVNVYDADSAKQIEKTKKRDDDMEALMIQLLEKLKPLLPKIPGGLYNVPPLVMPDLSSGPASGFVVEYLTKERLKPGEAASKFKGELKGWRRLQVAGLTTSSNEFYVKMHLLHAGLGGPATAGNLVPAFSAENTKFYHGVEKTAVDYLKDPKAIMWYEIVVSYGSAYEGDYVDNVYMKYGTYIQENGKFVKDPEPLGHRPSGKLTDVIPLPMLKDMREGQIKSVTDELRNADGFAKALQIVASSGGDMDDIKQYFETERPEYNDKFIAFMSKEGEYFKI